MEMFRYVRFAGGKMYRNVKEHFEYFWCLFDGSHMIGTAALKKLDEKRYYLDCGNKEDWEQFLKVNYDITEKQIFDDYKLFLQAKAELNEDANREKLDKMKQKLTNKEGNNVQSIYNQPVQSVHNESVPVHQSNINNQQMDSNNVPTTTMLLPGINVPVTTKVNNLDGNAGGIPTMEQGTTTIDKKGAKHVR